MVNGIDSLISLSDFSLLVYRNASDFCVLILYLETLLNPLITSSNFLVVSLGLYIYTITLSASRRVLLFFPIQIPFIYFFSSLIAMTRTSKTILSNSDESGNPCLVAGLGSIT